MLRTLPPDDVLYEALVRRDAGFDGVAFAGITTTGIFCRSTCPARKPRREHVEFFASAEAALLAGYRPCRRCRPLDPPGEPTGAVRRLIELVEAEPERRWRDADYRRLGIDASTARRRFKERFGMTFVQYARARRMGMALRRIRAGGRVIDAQLDAGYESGSGFRDAFARILATSPARAVATRSLSAAWLDTPLGPMLAVADEEALHLLEFCDRRGLEREIERLRQRLGAAICPGRSDPIERLEPDLRRYFAGTDLSLASVPLALHGSGFQRAVWTELRTIAPGTTRSYAALARAVGRPRAVRAVAQANGANCLALVVPCHRVIRSDGDLCGYGGRVWRKRWLLDHEARHREARPAPERGSAAGAEAPSA